MATYEPDSKIREDTSPFPPVPNFGRYHCVPFVRLRTEIVGFPQYAVPLESDMRTHERYAPERIRIVPVVSSDAVGVVIHPIPR